jgi:hypothetical protein
LEVLRGQSSINLGILLLEQTYSTATLEFYL